MRAIAERINYLFARALDRTGGVDEKERDWGWEGRGRESGKCVLSRRQKSSEKIRAGGEFGGVWGGGGRSRVGF